MRHLPRRRQARLERFREILETMAGRVRQEVRQTRARAFQGISASCTLTSLPNWFGLLAFPLRMISVCGSKRLMILYGYLVNQIITHYEVFAERPEDSQLLVSAVDQHQRRFGRAPRMVAAHARFYSLKNEKTIQGMGVTRVAVPNRNSKSCERRKLQKTRWFRSWQCWRTGCEGRISVLK